MSAYQGGLISQETAINESQFEIDAKDEMARQQAEKEADYQETRRRSLEGPEEDGEAEHG